MSEAVQSPTQFHYDNQGNNQINDQEYKLHSDNKELNNSSPKPKKKNLPKLKIVFVADELGNALSYRYLSLAKSDKVLLLIDFFSTKKVGEWLDLRTLYNEMKIMHNMISKTLPQKMRYNYMKRTTLYSLLELMAGVERVEIKSGNKFNVLAKRPILVKQSSYCKKLNAVDLPEYMQAPIYVSRGH